MNSTAEKYQLLNRDKQKAIQYKLCEKALVVWKKNCPSNGTYIEYVTGTTQSIDFNLPKNALTSVKENRDIADVENRYLEPITALQDDGLQLNEVAQYAFYAIYNLFGLHIKKKELDSLLIINQSISALGISGVSIFEEEVQKNA